MNRRGFIAGLLAVPVAALAKKIEPKRGFACGGIVPKSSTPYLVGSHVCEFPNIAWRGRRMGKTVAARQARNILIQSRNAELMQSALLHDYLEGKIASDIYELHGDILRG